MNININNTGAVLRAGKVSNGPNQSKKNFSGQKREPRLQSDPMYRPIRAKLDVSHRSEQPRLQSAPL
jgi:hypothetical protein